MRSTRIRLKATAQEGFMGQLNQIQCVVCGEGGPSGNRLDGSADSERGRCTATERPQHHDPVMSQHRLESPRNNDLRIRAMQQAQRLCIPTARPSASSCAWQSRQRRPVFHAQRRTARTVITISRGPWLAYQQGVQPCELGGSQLECLFPLRALESAAVPTRPIEVPDPTCRMPAPANTGVPRHWCALALRS